jgi:hypothetical protein
MQQRSHTATIATKKTVAEVQQLLSRHGATAAMVEYAMGDAVAMKFKNLVEGDTLGYRMLIDGKAVVQGMRPHSVARQRLRDASVHVDR